MKKFTYLFISMAFILGCSVDPVETDPSENLLNAKGKIGSKAQDKVAFGTPTLSLEEATENSLKVRITAGENGATGGLSVRWMTLEDYETFGWNNDLGGHANLKANPQHPEYNLGEGGYVIFNLEDFIDVEAYLENGSSFNRPLECGLSYMFSVQASQDGQTTKSEYSEPMEFSTAPCEAVCTYGFGYWKTHGPVTPGNQDNMWLVENMDLGSVNYSPESLLEIMEAPVQGNGLTSLAHHLIAAKLNIANGVDDSAISATIIAADEKIADQEILNGFLTTDEVEDLKNELEAFNESNPCEDEEDDELTVE